MFLPFFIAILLGLACPSHTTKTTHNSKDTTVTTSGLTAGDDTGGDTGHIPPRHP